MTFKQFLKEEWAASYKVGDKSVEVFRNPSPNEINPKVSRAFLLPNGTLYVWDGNIANHGEIARQIISLTKLDVPMIPLIWDGAGAGGGGKLAIASSIKYLNPPQSKNLPTAAQRVSANKNVRKFYGQVVVDANILSW